MSAIIEFLRVFSSMLRSGRMSYSDALTRFRAQYARPADGIEKAAIMKEVKQAPSNIVQFPKERITNPFKPRPTEAELKAKFDKQNKETAERIRQRRYEEAVENEKRMTELDPDYIPDIIDPKDFASGGIARVGYFKGGKVWKDFIEKLFIKSSNDIRLGKGKWAGLDQKQKMVQHDNLTKLVEQFQKTGKFDKKANEYFGIDAEKAFAGATKKVKKDRVATADELDDYIEILDPTGETGVVEEGMTIRQLDDMVADHKAYEAEMYADYKSGALDKYVKPEVLEEQKLFRQKKIDEVLDKAYDEVFYQKPATGDYKLDADVLSDSIVEQLGKGSLDELPQTYQTQIHNTALRRITDDMKINRAKKIAEKNIADIEQKIELQMFDPKDRKPNAYGGIAGQLHLNRPGYKSGTLVKLFNLLKGKKKTNAEVMEEILKNIRKDTSPPRIDMKKLRAGKEPIKVYSGSTIRQTNTPKHFSDLAEQLGTTPEIIAKDQFKDQWFTPFESYAKGFTDPKDITSKMRTVDLTPKEVAIAKRYVEKINKKHQLASMRKKLKIDKGPLHSVTTDENLVLIPRYKLKELEKSGRMKKDYMILEKLKKKMGLAKGGLAHVLGV